MSTTPVRPERLVLVPGLLAGLVLCLLTPPFGVADEPAHLYRAYALSEGRLAAVERDGAVGGELPASLPHLVETLRADLPGHPERKLAPAAILAALGEPLAAERRVMVDFRATARYPPLAYLPQAAGIALGRLAGAPALALLYLGRLGNLLAATALLWLALRLLPAQRFAATLVAVGPMAVFQSASLSADALTTALGFLATAAAAALAWGPPAELRRSGRALATASSVALCLTKAAYAPLALIVFLIPADRLPEGRRRFLTTHAVLVAAALGLASWMAAGVHLSVRPEADVRPRAQALRALADPLDVASIFGRDLLTHGKRYLAQVAGIQLGWLDTRLPTVVVLVFLALLAALLAADCDARPAGKALGLSRRLALAGLVLATLLLVIASQFLLWTPFGAEEIQGVQGRYLLPLVPAAALLFHRRKPPFAPPPAWLAAALAVASTLVLGVAAWAIATRFYGGG